MPKIIQQSISILSDAGLGMAMFSLGTYCVVFLIFFLTRVLVLSTVTIYLHTRVNSEYLVLLNIRTDR